MNAVVKGRPDGRTTNVVALDEAVFFVREAGD